MNIIMYLFVIYNLASYIWNNKVVCKSVNTLFIFTIKHLFHLTSFLKFQLKYLNNCFLGVVVKKLWLAFIWYALICSIFHFLNKEDGSIVIVFIHTPFPIFPQYLVLMSCFINLKYINLTALIPAFNASSVKFPLKAFFDIYYSSDNGQNINK